MKASDEPITLQPISKDLQGGDQIMDRSNLSATMSICRQDFDDFASKQPIPLGCITIPPRHNSATYSFNTILIVGFSTVLDFLPFGVFHLREVSLAQSTFFVDNPLEFMTMI